LHAGVDREIRLRIDHFDDLYGVAAFNQIRHRVLADGDCAIELPLAPAFATASEGNTKQTRALPSKVAPTSLVVITEEIPEATSSEDRATIKRYSALCNPQPIAWMPSADWLIERERRLLAEFPWATRVVRGIFQDLIARRYCGVTEVGIRPILILGAPGVSKTRLARRIAEELGMPFLPIGLAGADDSRMILGTPEGGPADSPPQSWTCCCAMALVQRWTCSMKSKKPPTDPRIHRQPARFCLGFWSLSRYVVGRTLFCRSNVT
jgi:hypothetical protein